MLKMGHKKFLAIIATEQLPNYWISWKKLRILLNWS